MTELRERFRACRAYIDGCGVRKPMALIEWVDHGLTIDEKEELAQALAGAVRKRHEALIGRLENAIAILKEIDPNKEHENGHV